MAKKKSTPAKGKTEAAESNGKIIIEFNGNDTIFSREGEIQVRDAIVALEHLKLNYLLNLKKEKVENPKLKKGAKK